MSGFWMGWKARLKHEDGRMKEEINHRCTRMNTDFGWNEIADGFLWAWVVLMIGSGFYLIIVGFAQPHTPRRGISSPEPPNKYVGWREWRNCGNVGTRREEKRACVLDGLESKVEA